MINIEQDIDNIVLGTEVDETSHKLDTWLQS